MRKIFLLIIALFFFAGCATFPPPRIQDGRYINPKYGFSVEVPGGWYQTEKTPTWFKDILTEEKKSQIRIMFFNNDTNGLIFIMSSKSLWSFDLVNYAYERIEKNLQEAAEKKKKKLSKDPYVKNYSYKIYSIENWCESFSYETEFNKTEMRGEYTMYGCCGDDTCVAGIELISDIKTFAENYEVFRKMVNSFQGWLF